MDKFKVVAIGIVLLVFVFMFGSTIGDVGNEILSNVVITGTDVVKSMTVQWYMPVLLIALIAAIIIMMFRRKNYKNTPKY